LYIQEVGMVGLPLSAADAEKIAAASGQAALVEMTGSIFPSSKCLEHSWSVLRNKNPSWASLYQKLFANIKETLGI